ATPEASPTPVPSESLPASPAPETVVPSAIGQRHMSGRLWEPDPAAVRRTALDRVMREVEKITDLPMTTTADFHDCSISSPGDFWDLVWGECEVIGDRGDGS